MTYSERHKAWSAKDLGSSPEDTRRKLPRVPSHWSHPGCASSCDDVCAVSSSSCSEAHRPGFSLGAGHIGTLCLARTKILESRRKAQQKPQSTNNMGSVSLPHHLGDGGNPPGLPGHQPRASLSSRCPFQESSFRLHALLTLVCTPRSDAHPLLRSIPEPGSNHPGHPFGFAPGMQSWG